MEEITAATVQASMAPPLAALYCIALHCIARRQGVGAARASKIGVDKEPQVSNLFVSPLGADNPCDTDLFVRPENTDLL